MAIRILLQPSSHRASLVSVVLLVALLLATSSTASATPDERYGHRHQYRSRRLLVTAPRVSPETARTEAQQQQEMHVGGWLAAAPFMGALSSLGRRIPRSHGNPSHN